MPETDSLLDISMALLLAPTLSQAFERFEWSLFCYVSLTTPSIPSTRLTMIRRGVTTLISLIRAIPLPLNTTAYTSILPDSPVNTMNQQRGEGSYQMSGCCSGIISRAFRLFRMLRDPYHGPMQGEEKIKDEVLHDAGTKCDSITVV